MPSAVERLIGARLEEVNGRLRGLKRDMQSWNDRLENVRREMDELHAERMELEEALNVSD